MTEKNEMPDLSLKTLYRRLQRANDRIRDLESMHKCGCTHDYPEDVCMFHQKLIDEKTKVYFDRIEKLESRILLLEGYLNGALNVIEKFVHCDTQEARAALEKKDDKGEKRND